LLSPINIGLARLSLAKRFRFLAVAEVARALQQVCFPPHKLMSILAQREQFSGKSHCTNVFGKQVHRCYQSTNGTSNGTRRKKLLAAFQEVSAVLLVHITHSASPTKKPFSSRL
jgi:hypothetical protein